MKNRIATTMLFGAMLACSAAAHASTNLIVDGSFSAPNQNGGWSAVSNGNVPGWTNISGNNDGIEIDNSSLLGGSAYTGTTQSAELNGTTWDTISQIVTGLVVGEEYTLSWAYGQRPGSGFQQTNVSFGGAAITTDTSSGNATNLTWTLNTFNVIATSTTEDLNFAAVATNGNSALGNEITAVSLIDTGNSVPEPMTPALIGLGLVALAVVRRKAQQ